ncbi:FeoA family protein [Seleniivibrio woodruffii]|uniref:Ferrous iron transport protein A n=1 Tax=Seleniivibrio woodruffii TaxID=1078050 RepID=A0A4R1K8J6_9BACT|nr:FeoA family protein [Seleniivibrio woodruffii]TCK60662.1 ferrous iron transport protein A [Seleniivibrio woodruffii]TVZ36292.1 ferrous iron transport protein A [Seleniivibrio woodruffii]
MIISMRKMKDNQKGRIVKVNCEGELRQRINDMGLTSGAEFKVIGRAPLFDPVALKIRGFTITLRNNEADHIEVEVID